MRRATRRPRGRRPRRIAKLATEARQGSGRSALLVGAGILTSRISGFARDVVIAAFFGLGPLMDAYTAALRIPNILRNLLGEGTLSASFVPVFSAALGRGSEDARRIARNVLGWVLAVAGLVVAVGVATAPLLARLVAPGFDAELSGLTARMVRILFPTAGLMIAGAWCLGVLTSHRRFFLPFAAPVVWNLAQIAGLLWGARQGWEPLIVVLAWSTLAGSALQIAVQLPTVRRLVGSLRPSLERGFEPATRVARNAVPVAAGQGIFQVSSFTDVVLASTLVAAGWGGAVSGLYFAQRLVMLPMSLFGVSVAVAALPEMSREGTRDALLPHLERGVRQILYFIVPSAVLLGLFGDVIAAVLFERGEFDAEDVRIVQWVLAAYAIGLVATGLVKLMASTFHAMQDTKTPLKYAAFAVTIGIAAAAGLMFWMAGRGYEARAAAGLALGGAIGAWLNLGLLARGLRRRGLVGAFAKQRVALARIAAGTLAAAAAAWPARIWLSGVVGDDLWGRSLVLAGILAAGAALYLPIAGLPRPRGSPEA